MTTAAVPAPTPTVSLQPPPRAANPQPSRLDAPSAALVFGLITAAIQWLVWRSFHAVPVISDEMSYLLQARLFAHFHWTAPAVPMREFFEQAHVFASPVVASKYPPGHALLLALGVMVGLPGLVPVVLTGVTGALVFAITRRLVSGHAAVVAWLLWTFAPIPQGFRPSYFSEITTAATWVGGWWALLRWCDDSRSRWLILLSILTAWCAITRPLTAVAYAIPTGIVTLVLVRRRSAWRAAVAALFAGGAIIAIVPLWSWNTLGSARRTPYVVYDEIYQPYEHLGFGDNGKRTPTWVTPDVYMQLASQADYHVEYTRATFTHQLRERLRWTWNFTFGDAAWSAVLAAFIPVGVFALGVEGLVGAACVLMLLMAYLLYAHQPWWTIYYYEGIAPLCVLAAAGLARILQLFHRPPAFARRALIATTVCALPFALATAGRIREQKTFMLGSQTVFARGAAQLPHKPAIVFVRYAPNHSANVSLIDNDPDLAHADVWKVYDLGAEADARLRALAPARHAYLYDQATRTFVDLDGQPAR